MEIESFSSEELQAELDRRAAEAHELRESEVFRGEREESTDGDRHIEDSLENVASGNHFWGRGAANY